MREAAPGLSSEAAQPGVATSRPSHLELSPHMPLDQPFLFTGHYLGLSSHDPDWKPPTTVARGSCKVQNLGSQPSQDRFKHLLSLLIPLSHNILTCKVGIKPQEVLVSIKWVHICPGPSRVFCTEQVAKNVIRPCLPSLCSNVIPTTSKAPTQLSL